VAVNALSGVDHVVFQPQLKIKLTGQSVTPVNRAYNIKNKRLYEDKDMYLQLQQIAKPLKVKSIYKTG
jgi:hypothetical protein